MTASPARDPWVPAGYAISGLFVLFLAVMVFDTGLVGGGVGGFVGGAIFALIMLAPGLMLAFLIWLVSTGRHCFLIFLIGTSLCAVLAVVLAFIVATGGGNALGLVYATLLLMVGGFLGLFTVRAFRARRSVAA